MSEDWLDHRHDWRFLSSRVETEYEAGEVIPLGIAERIFDTWYCTICRKVETTERQ